jgi:hypothetical protein
MIACKKLLGKFSWLNSIVIELDIVFVYNFVIFTTILTLGSVFLVVGMLSGFTGAFPGRRVAYRCCQV